MQTDTERQASKRIARNLETIKRLRDETNDTLGIKVGRDRDWVQERTSGKRPITSGQVDVFADALRVPPQLIVTRDAAEILRFVADELSDGGLSASRWIDVDAGHDTLAAA